MTREKFRFAGQTREGQKRDPEVRRRRLHNRRLLAECNRRPFLDSNGNPAAMMYAIRTGSQGFDVPIDNEVVYGKIGSLGYLFHVSELILPKEGE